MHNLPFDTVSLAADDVQALENCYNVLLANFNIDISDNIHVATDQFDLLNNENATVGIGGTLLIDTPGKNCHLIFLKLNYSYYGLRSATRTEYFKYKVWALVTLKSDFGRVLIRRETFNDRLVALLHPVELEFKDDKLFSHKFYVVTNDEQKALLAMNWNFRNAVMDMGDDMMMEAAGHSIIIGDNKWCCDPAAVIAAARFACKIAAL